MIRRRDLWAAIGIAGVAVLLLTFAIGSMVSLGVHAGHHALGDAHDDAVATTPPDEPFVAADRVPVLCYHYIRGGGNPLQIVRVFGYVVLSLPLMDDTEIWRVGRRSFERQIDYLARRGYRTVSLDDLHEWQMGRRVLPAKSIVITFDDADESVYDYAYPVLQKYGMRATVFVVTSQAGKHWNGIRVLDWDRLREMQRSGVFEIESHTHDYHYKVGERGNAMPVFAASSDAVAARAGGTGANPGDALFRDLARSRETIERQIGTSPRYLAWPYGFGNAAVDQVALDAGFSRTLSLRARPNHRLTGDRFLLSDTERFEIPRYTVTARTSLRTFHEMLDGTYSPAK
ncbi:MAG TPA: polysaccharide deacetylase family protein [Candidatus Krumholzibacteria bacterium]